MGKTGSIILHKYTAGGGGYRRFHPELEWLSALFSGIFYVLELCLRLFLSYLLNAHCCSLFIGQVNVLDCGLYLGNAAWDLLAGLTDVISSDCRLTPSFRPSLFC